MPYSSTEQQQASQYTRSLIEASLDPLVTISPEGKITDVNEATIKVTGMPREQLIGTDFSNYFTEPDNAREGYRQVFEKGFVTDYPLTIRHSAGKQVDVLYNASVYRDVNGNVLGVFAAARDVTEQRQASQYARSLIEASLDPLVTISPEGKITDVNEATARVTGVSRGQLIGSDFSSYFTDPESARRGYEQVFRQGAVQDYPLAIRGTGGKVTDVLYNATVFRNEAGEVEGVFAAARDITERKRVEDALRESQERFEAMANGIPQLAWMAEPDGHIFWYNQRWYDYTGTTFEQMEGWAWQSVQDPEVLPRVLVAWKGAIASGKPFDMEFPLRGADGIFRMFLTRVMPFKDSAGRVVRWFGTNTDISERKRAEEEISKLNRELEERVQQRTAQLRESEQRVRRKLESILSPEGDLGSLELADILDVPAVQSLVDEFYKLAHIPVFILDLEGTALVSVGWQEICTEFHRAHPEACMNCKESDRELSTGVAPGEFKLHKCKNNMWDAVTPIMVGGQQVGNLFSGQFFLSDEQVDYTLFHEQARRYGFDEQAYIACLDRVPRLSREEVETGMAVYIKLAQLLSQLSYSGIKLARSLAELNRVNSALAASVKELEAFNYAVAHDLRAPLRHIHGFAELLGEEAGSILSDSSKRHLETIRDSVRHMGQLLEDLLTLSRLGRQELRKQVCGLNSLVKEVVTGLKPEIKGREVEWRIAELPFVECDPALMKQILVNLLSNALKFTKFRQSAIIEIGQTTVDGEPVIFVRDNGVGFSMKYVDKLFGLFQRLHRQEDFEGTGVGLAIVQRIVHRHGGRVWAEAELNQGATFYLSLQTCEAERNEQAVAQAAV